MKHSKQMEEGLGKLVMLPYQLRSQRLRGGTPNGDGGFRQSGEHEYSDLFALDGVSRCESRP